MKRELGLGLDGGARGGVGNVEKFESTHNDTRVAGRGR